MIGINFQGVLDRRTFIGLLLTEVFLVVFNGEMAFGRASMEKRPIEKLQWTSMWSSKDLEIPVGLLCIEGFFLQKITKKNYRWTL